MLASAGNTSELLGSKPRHKGYGLRDRGFFVFHAAAALLSRPDILRLDVPAINCAARLLPCNPAVSPALCQQLTFLLYPQQGGPPRAEPRSEQPSPAETRQAERVCEQLLDALQSWLSQHPECLSGSRGKPRIRVRAGYILELQLFNFSPELLESIRSALDSAAAKHGMKGMLSACRGRHGFKSPPELF